MQFHQFLPLFFWFGIVVADLCAHCDCDQSEQSVTCSKRELLLRTVSLLPHISQVYLHHLTLPHPPHFLYHPNLRILRINYCGLEEMSAHALLPLPNLEVVSLAHNKLETLPATLFRRQDKLKVVDVSHNNLHDLSQIEWILADQVLLDVLDIGHNPVELSTKTSHLPSTRQLILANLNIASINGSSILFASSANCLEEHCRVLPFPDTNHLNFLDLAENEATIDATALKKLLNVTNLNLAHTHLPPEFFDWLETSNVVHLNMSHAQIDLPDNEWRWCGPRLESLDISGLRTKRLRLPRGCPLRRLFARDNQLEFASFEAPYLEAIYLDRNLFTEWPALPEGSVLEHLDTFSIASNLLTTLPPHALTHFPNLQYIDISRNQLSQIDPNAFPSLGMQLISIDMSYNQLTSLVHPVLPSLLFLDISSNNIDDINPVLFAGMPLLQHLKLANNPKIFAKCVDRCWSDHLNVLTNLVDLDLSNCQLERRLDLSTQFSLKSLIIRGNQLGALDGSVLPPSLAVLDAGENLIHFTANMTRLTALRDLRLDSNPLICDCSLDEIRELLVNQTSIANPQVYYCFSSSWQYPLLPYLTSVRPCPAPSPPTLPIAVSAIVGCFIIVFCVMLMLITVHRFFPNLLTKKYKRLATEFPVRL